MKLTNTLSMKRKSGMTLLELTVVILVLLSLISILFIGAVTLFRYLPEPTISVEASASAMFMPRTFE